MTARSRRTSAEIGKVKFMAAPREELEGLLVGQLFDSMQNGPGEDYWAAVAEVERRGSNRSREISHRSGGSGQNDRRIHKAKCSLHVLVSDRHFFDGWRERCFPTCDFNSGLGSGGPVFMNPRL
jgi:hypothetical protein